MARQVAPLGWPFEIIVAMTDNLAVTDGAINVIVGTSGLSGGKTLNLPTVQQMVASQNPAIIVVNKAASGGTINLKNHGNLSSSEIVLENRKHYRWCGYLVGISDARGAGRYGDNRVGQEHRWIWFAGFI